MLSLTRSLRFAGLLLCCVSTIMLRAEPEPVPSARELENLAAFAKVYGYVHYFYPDLRSEGLDWDKLSVLGIEEVRQAQDETALRDKILSVLGPLAPRLRLETTNAGTDFADPETEGSASIFWQYAGIFLSKDSRIYKHVLVNHTGGDNNGKPLFAAQPPPRFFRVILPEKLRLLMPLALSAEENAKDDNRGIDELNLVKRRAGDISLEREGYADWRVRVAAVIKVWTIFQHFHPYLDVIGVDWNAALVPALKEAILAQDAEGEYQVLMRLIAKTHDGHGYVYGRSHAVGGIPMRLARAGDALVISGAAEGVPLKKGDLLESIDGGPASQVLSKVMAMSPGSPQLSEYRALNQVGFGPLMSTAKLGVLRDGQHLEIEIVREKEKRGYFFNTIPEFNFPPLAELQPGIFYVNIQVCSRELFVSKLEQLAKAKAVIFDWRWDGLTRPLGAKSIQVSGDVIPHLIDKEVTASPMMIPQTSQPDRQGWAFRESTWPVKPQAPRLGGKIIFINEPATVSYGETCMAIIADYKLATLVGAPTAGTNGNANFIPLPCDLRVMWTGMDVRRHDRSIFYDKGFVPDFEVKRTVEGVKAGRDEYLEKALEVAEKH